jgi:Glycosyl hydrolase family 79, N-terminal domain
VNLNCYCLYAKNFNHSVQPFIGFNRAKIYFGLNALSGRIPLSDGSYGGPWESSNAESLIQYTVNKGYTIHGWELGEITCNHVC